MLKTIGATSVVGSGFTVTGTASRGSRLEGIAYDPYTREIIGEASAQFNQQTDELVGNLRVNDKKYNMNQNEPHTETNGEELKSQSFREVTQKEDKQYNELIKVTVTDKSNITGFVRSPESLERTAFALTNSQEASIQSNGNHDKLIQAVERLQGGENNE